MVALRDAVAGRAAIRMRGDLSLENNGGFVQIALDLSPDGGVVDASAWSGIELDVFGNGEEYGVHLRTDALTRPWQSYRQIFSAYAEWRTVQLPFDHLGINRNHLSVAAQAWQRECIPSSLGQGCSADARRLFDRGSPHTWKPVGTWTSLHALFGRLPRRWRFASARRCGCRNVLEGFFALSEAWALQTLAAVGPLQTPAAVGPQGRRERLASPP